MNNPVLFGPSLLARSLRAALRDIESPKLGVRHAAARDLGRYIDGPERLTVVARLIRAMQTDTDTEVRVSALMALVDAAANEAVEDILAVARQGEPRLRQVALLAIGELAELGSEEGIRVASEAIHSELPALRYQALVALRNLQQLGAMDKIVESARDDDPEVRWVVVRLLEEFWTFDIVSGTDDITRREVEQKVCLALSPLLNDVESRVRVAATLLLARLGVAEAAEAISGLLSKKDVKLNKNDEEVAIELAGNLRISSAILGLKRRAWPLFWETPLSWKARVALAQMGDERARVAVLESLHSKLAHKCARAIEAAGQIGLEQARPRLLALLQNPTGYDAEAIQIALKRLGPPA